MRVLLPLSLRKTQANNPHASSSSLSDQSGIEEGEVEFVQTEENVDIVTAEATLDKDPAATPPGGVFHVHFSSGFGRDLPNAMQHRLTEPKI